MRLLLDTHTFDSPQLLTPSMRGLLEDPAVERWVSVVALIEIAVKVRKRKLELPLQREYFLDQIEALSAKLLPIEAEHCFTLLSLPRHHGDPFDRLLISQAKFERLTIATRDGAFAEYGVPTVW